MRAQFSEFSYGFALTHELIEQSRGTLVAAPRFPSLREEGREGGYDVKIEYPCRPVFLQFKLSERMERSTANEWGSFGTPYLRFSIYSTRRSRQHAMLVDLNRRGRAVYYAAPEFVNEDELTRAFLNRETAARSAFVRPAEIGPLTDDRSHCFAFEAGAEWGYFFSTPKPIEILRSEHVFLDVEELSPVGRIDSSEGFKKLANDIRGVITERHYESAGIVADVIGSHPPAVAVAFMARLFLGAEFLLLRADT